MAATEDESERAIECSPTPAHKRAKHLAFSTGRRRPVTAEVYEDHGVHFEYPSSWSLEVTDEGPVTTVDLQQDRKSVV